MKKYLLATAAMALAVSVNYGALAADAAMAKPGEALDMVLLPKFLGILPFDQAHQGAEEAAKELGNPTPLQFLGPTPENSVAVPLSAPLGSALWAPVYSCRATWKLLPPKPKLDTPARRG